MLGIVVNEEIIVNDIVKNKQLNVKHGIAIGILTKYYYCNGTRKPVEVYEEIIKDLQKCDISFNRSKWDEYIKGSVSKYIKYIEKNNIETKINVISEILITKEELLLIENLNNKKLEKIAFVLLVYSKIYNKISNLKDGWVNQKHTNIFKEAKVSARGNDKQLLLHELYKKEYISQVKKNDKEDIKINYIRDDSEAVMIIKDFDGVVHEYLKYKNENWKRCTVCNSWILQKSKKPRIYCNKCAKEKNVEKTIKNRKSLI